MTFLRIVLVTLTESEVGPDETAIPSSFMREAKLLTCGCGSWPKELAELPQELPAVVQAESVQDDMVAGRFGGKENVFS